MIPFFDQICTGLFFYKCSCSIERPLRNKLKVSAIVCGFLFSILVYLVKVRALYIKTLSPVPSHVPAAIQFAYSGSAQFFTVPFGVDCVLVYMWGGGGYEGAGVYVESTLSVNQGCVLNITVAGAGFLNAGDRCRRDGLVCNGEGGRTLIQISGEEILVAAGGRGRVSSLMSPPYVDHTLHQSPFHLNNRACNGKLSKYFNTSACGRGGEETTSQNGLVVIEPFTSSISPRKIFSVSSNDLSFTSKVPTVYPAALSGSSASPTQAPSVSPTTHHTDSSEGGSFLLFIATPVAFLAMVLVVILVQCYRKYFIRNNVNTLPGAVVAIDVSLPVALATVVSPSSTEAWLTSDESVSVYMAVTSAELYDDDLNIAETAVPSVSVHSAFV